MTEYKINYEAPPISEVIKVVFIEAKDEQAAIDDFNKREIVGATIINITPYT